MKWTYPDWWYRSMSLNVRWKTWLGFYRPDRGLENRLRPHVGSRAYLDAEAVMWERMSLHVLLRGTAQRLEQEAGRR